MGGLGRAPLWSASRLAAGGTTGSDPPFSSNCHPPAAGPKHQRTVRASESGTGWDREVDPGQRHLDRRDGTPVRPSAGDQGRALRGGTSIDDARLVARCTSRWCARGTVSAPSRCAATARRRSSASWARSSAACTASRTKTWCGVWRSTKPRPGSPTSRSGSGTPSPSSSASCTWWGASTRSRRSRPGCARRCRSTTSTCCSSPSGTISWATRSRRSKRCSKRRVRICPPTARDGRGVWFRTPRVPCRCDRDQRGNCSVCCSPW